MARVYSVAQGRLGNRQSPLRHEGSDEVAVRAVQIGQKSQRCRVRAGRQRLDRGDGEGSSLETRIAPQELGRDRFRFRLEHAAHGVDEATARPHVTSRRRGDVGLEMGEVGDILGRPPQEHVGTATQGAAPGAGRVDEDGVVGAFHLAAPARPVDAERVPRRQIEPPPARAAAD